MEFGEKKMSGFGECPCLWKECLQEKCIYYNDSGDCILQTCDNCTYQHDNACTLHGFEYVSSTDWCRDGDFIEQDSDECDYIVGDNDVEINQLKTQIKIFEACLDDIRYRIGWQYVCTNRDCPNKNNGKINRRYCQYCKDLEYDIE